MSRRRLISILAFLAGTCFVTDADRDWAYDRASHISKLDAAWDEGLAEGWAIVDMKKDGKTIHPPAR